VTIALRLRNAFVIQRACHVTQAVTMAESDTHAALMDPLTFRLVRSPRALIAPLSVALWIGCGPTPDDDASGTGGSSSSGGSSQTGGSSQSGGSSSTGGTTGADDPPSGTACAKAERLGSFVFNLTDTRTSLRGAVSNGVAVNSIPEVLAAAGGCELQGVPNLFCATPCESGEICAGDDQCVPAPEKVSAGTITVTGLATELVEDPNAITLDYSANFDEPYPGFSPGARIVLSAAGDTAPAFTLIGEGVGLLSSTLETAVVETDADLELTWDSSGATEHSQIGILLTVDAHGGTSGWIACVADDTGAFAIPADLVQQLIDLGLSGFPRVVLTRQTVDSKAVGDGCVDMTVGSELELPISIDGLISCNDDDQCPEGQTCNADLACE
jgi:hypothetical protein